MIPYPKTELPISTVQWTGALIVIILAISMIMFCCISSMNRKAEIRYKHLLSILEKSQINSTTIPMNNTTDHVITYDQFINNNKNTEKSMHSMKTTECPKV
ncbi:hypothetical protein NEPAR06_0654 [Nematocida parisii]|uniref:Uncharacterized protein n=1 Tax=Nematocida parisii (strain ERTm3) TaxID=935791 RepID=I3EEZ9_NEMP3|nr:uncharacterized protein NEPG_01976 [Nematocida parisii ERTm1]EIJ87796.1 hypothetical protein NEQG_01868 [Nematocida parisii ERTm3]KAI5127239.1 hypothetical protein NEPAR08_0836 [Nematocida parisii]EIJ93020.1 hypothetical protein NEPG_01976 [Nematocida parisii ERTm1]KAI5127264.1 hypothetical protein NEPAR03_0868 [Nematocida parisii]KAI5141373.1 hypothetical protein NEPAR04_0926 [Nematocida parisii]|eukprot:XP_013059803.1 hypothetical protein NEPG_01976 [Nematocida parisii ERTm1]